MPKKSLRDLEAFLRARGAGTQAEIEWLLRDWRVVMREETMQALKGPGGTCVIRTIGAGKEELRTLQLRAIAEDGDFADLEDLPGDGDLENEDEAQ
ncbi:MAG TPA: hypothetical protein VGM86_29785 [Thermoanaerobaculia bacterium]